MSFASGGFCLLSNAGATLRLRGPMLGIPELHPKDWPLPSHGASPPEAKPLSGSRCQRGKNYGPCHQQHIRNAYQYTSLCCITSLCFRVFCFLSPFGVLLGMTSTLKYKLYAAGITPHSLEAMEIPAPSTLETVPFFVWGGYPMCYRMLSTILGTKRSPALRLFSFSTKWLFCLVWTAWPPNLKPISEDGLLIEKNASVRLACRRVCWAFLDSWLTVGSVSLLGPVIRKPTEQAS